ncbi:MAG: hypothetical protein KAG97_06385 [Victivallales bacterium]|nr:hypothetical protein [Victivallales bacterium]
MNHLLSKLECSANLFLHKSGKLVHQLSALGCAVFLFGCHSTPGPKPEFAEFAEPPNPNEVLAVFRASLPKKFTMRQTAVVDSERGRMAAIGVCSFDKAAKRFALVLMTPTGMTLLKIEKNGAAVSSRFHLPGASPGGKAAAQIAQDAWRIYSHPNDVPDSSEVRGNKMIFTWRNGKETERLVFGRSATSATLDLKTKVVSLNGLQECVIHYFKYSDAPDGTRRPTISTYWNRRFNYFLTIKSGKD